MTCDQYGYDIAEVAERTPLVGGDHDPLCGRRGESIRNIWPAKSRARDALSVEGSATIVSSQYFKHQKSEMAITSEHALVAVVFRTVKMAKTWSLVESSCMSSVRMSSQSRTGSLFA